MKWPSRRLQRGNGTKVRGPFNWIFAGSLSLLASTVPGCAQAPDKSSGEQSEEPDASEDPSENPTEKSTEEPSEELTKFAKAFPKRFKKLNAFACEVDSDLCVEQLSEAQTDDIRMSFFLTFQKKDLKTKRHADYLDCFTKALKASGDCADNCKDASEDDECEEKGMDKCVEAFSDDELKTCDLKKPSASSVFEDAIGALNLRLGDEGGG